MHAWLSIEGQLHILDFQQSLSGQCRWLKCSGDQPRPWQYFGHQGLALTLDLLLYSCFPTSVFQFLIWLQTLPYHQFSFSLVSVLTSLSAHLILSKAFPSHFLPVDVVLYPLHFSWIVSFCAVLWNDSHRCCKSEYPKIKFKAADVSVGIEPDWACSSHTSVGKVTSNLLHSEFGTDRILVVFHPDVGTEQLQHTFSSFLLLSPISCPIFQDVFPYLWTLTDAGKVKLCSEMWKCQWFWIRGCNLY